MAFSGKLWIEVVKPVSFNLDKPEFIKRDLTKLY